VVAAVIERRGRYLLAQRPRDRAHGGLWEFPGGKVNRDENFAQALARELAEELVMQDCDIGQVLAVLHDDEQRLRLHFIAVATRSAPIALEHEALGWFLPQEARALDLAPLDKAFLENFDAAVPSTD